MLDLMVKIMLTLWLLTAVLFPAAVLQWPDVNRVPALVLCGITVLIMSTAGWTVLTAFAAIWL